MKVKRGIIVVLLLTLMVVLSQCKKKDAPVVIGANQATAAAAEEQRKQKGGGGKSPMPTTTYDFWRGEESLVNPVKNALDSELSELCQRFLRSDAQLRTEMRASMSMDEFYTLLSFSRRSAVFAIRERNPNWVNNGLIAIAMIEAERTDTLDIRAALRLLHHAAGRIGADADRLVRAAAKLAEPDVSELLTGFIQKPEKEKGLFSSGYDEVETKDGIGFIGWKFKDYSPTYDLKRIVVDIADLVAKDKYQPSVLEVAEEFPPFWLESEENNSVELTLQKVLAGAYVHAKLRPNEHPTYESQILMIFLVEVEDERVAQELLDMSRKKKSENYSMIGIAEESLFCLVIGESFEIAVKSFETPESMPRFEKGVAEILRKYSKKGL